VQQLCIRPAQLRHRRSQAAVTPVLRRRSRRTVAAMRRLILVSTATVLAFLLLVPSAWAEWIWPVHGDVITPYRNGTDPYASGQHRGIDIAAAMGATVVAATSGEVRFAGTAGSSGLTVSVRTADGRYDISYLHLSSTSVGEGDRVAAGQPVGAVGTSGTRSATEPHLHFGVRDAGSRHAYHDPLGFLPPPTTMQPPRGAPAPEPAPVPISPAPAPAPVNAPAARRVPVGAPAPRRVPVGAPGRVPARAPRRVPAAEPRRVPEPGRVPAGAPRRVPAGAPRRVPAAEPLRVPAGEPGRVPAGAQRSQPARATSRVPTTEPHNAPAEDAARSPAGAPGFAPAGTPRHEWADAAGRAPVRAPTSDDSAAPHQSGARPEPGSARSPQASGPDLGLVAACLGLLAAAALLGLTGDGRNATRETRHRIARVLQPMFGRR
jgi:Peptidase family M23